MRKDYKIVAINRIVLVFQRSMFVVGRITSRGNGIFPSLSCYVHCMLFGFISHTPLFLDLWPCLSQAIDRQTTRQETFLNLQDKKLVVTKMIYLS